jgi:D-aminopeptidase
MRNLITDVPGVLVGHAQNARVASGVTAVVFERPTTASLAIHGGAPGVRDTALLEPEMTVEGVDAFILSGGSAFGLDACGGAMAALAGQGRGFCVGPARVPIAPGAILFDLLNGGDKAWGRWPPYWDLGFAAVEAAGLDFALGTAGAGYGATTVNLKGGLGSASATASTGHVVGAIVAVNALGSATAGDDPRFWAAAFEQNAEFGGLGVAPPSEQALTIRMKGDAPHNTTIAVVATSATLTKAQCKRLAVQAHDGMALALQPSHAALDGDLVFAAATGADPRAATARDLTEFGALAARCLARAIARGVHEAKALEFPGALPDWKGRFAARAGARR